MQIIPDFHAVIERPGGKLDIWETSPRSRPQFIGQTTKDDVNDLLAARREIVLAE